MLVVIASSGTSVNRFSNGVSFIQAVRSISPNHERDEKCGPDDEPAVDG